MKTKIIIAIFIIFVGTVAYFAYPVFKNRYFQPAEDNLEQEKSSLNKKNNQFSDESSGNENVANSEDIDEDGKSTLDDNIFIDIDNEDCEDGCEQFEDADDKKYCQEYCGAGERNSPENIVSNCEESKDLEKDYCWKDKAIADKNFSFCKKIIDKKIQESCKTRLTENLINSSNSPIE